MIITNYKQRFAEKVTAFITEKVADRQTRLARMRALIDEYVVKYGDRPDKSELDRLTNYVFLEEFTDKRRSKAHEEYPILSERQLERRYEHEYSLDLAGAYDTDGKNRAKPYRRPRTNGESYFVDRESRRKNRRRNAQYKRDSANGKVSSYNLYDTGGELTESFVTARDMAGLWAEKLSDGTTEIINSTDTKVYG